MLFRSGNYVIFYINVQEDSKLLKQQASLSNVVVDPSIVPPRLRGDAIGLGEAGVGVWIASPYKRTYLRSALKNIDKFTINIVDPKGNPIFPTWDNSGVDEQIPPEELTNSATRDKYEFQIHFIFTVLENELNTKPNFR